MHIFAYGSNNVHPRLRWCFLYSKFTRKFLNNFLNALSNMSYTLSCRETACKDCGFRVTLSRIVWLIGLTLTLASCRNNILLSVWKFEKLSLRERYFWPNFFQTFKSGICDTNLRWIAKTLSMSFERSYIIIILENQIFIFFFAQLYDDSSKLVIDQSQKDGEFPFPIVIVWTGIGWSSGSSLDRLEILTKKKIQFWKFSVIMV